MEKILKEKLWDYIICNNPDLMYKLQEEYAVADFLQEKVNGVLTLSEEMLNDDTPAAVIEEICLNVMTEDLKPSQFKYLCRILSEEFEQTYLKFKNSGSIIYEVLKLMDLCSEVFDRIGFTKESEKNTELRTTVIKKITVHLKNRQ